MRSLEGAFAASVHVTFGETCKPIIGMFSVYKKSGFSVPPLFHLQAMKEKVFLKVKIKQM